MAKYIDAEKLKSAIRFEMMNLTRAQQKGCLYAIQAVDFAPTADVQEVKHGKWIYVGDPNYAHIFGFLYECSCCKRHITVDYQFELREYPYCHCGAKMDGEDESK